MRSEFENWFKTSRSYLALKEANYYDLNLFEFNESYKRYVHSGIQIAFETWQHQQSKVDELQKQVDAAQKLFDDWNCGGMNLFDLLDALEQALKGGEW